MNTEQVDSNPKESRPESVTLKKGTLWQQRDKFFSRWKERFFILTSDYLACFKKASKIGISEMGGFLYKVNLADVDDLQWIDKKQDGVIAVRVGTEDQLLLWSSKGLDNWMFALRDAVNLSKGRREALRRSQTLMPQLPDGGLIGRHRVNSHHSLSASPGPPGIVHSGSNLELCSNAGPFMRSLVDKHFMPSINEYSNRMSGDSNGDTDCDAASSCEYYPVTRHTFGPRLAPQCSSGSHSSLVSLGRRSENGQLYKPSPRSLQVSPALTQRSLYAQHILSSPEISQPPETRRTKSSSATSATSEFSFVHPDSPVAVSSLRLKHNRPGESKNKPHQLLQQQQSLGLPGNGFRPSSIYGQPSVGSSKLLSGQPPPDVVPFGNFKATESQSMPKRSAKCYSHSKSDSNYSNEGHMQAVNGTTNYS
ncbi:uncharacterized protein [Parasteatoda tepidariorum]|uniref:uncharacterized protein n=1 Tax=Parasteatoda tepidariorum TaxID=114398 RepID=UPI00077FD08D|nr:uncharacterized protein LOC107446359 isoform X2 [Parasteatoda tepidariorum]